MRVMDLWRAEDGKLVENWVYIDLLNLLLQIGVDVYERMNRLHRRGDASTFTKAHSRLLRRGSSARK
jgi:hypothetical protein